MKPGGDVEMHNGQRDMSTVPTLRSQGRGECAWAGVEYRPESTQLKRDGLEQCKSRACRQVSCTEACVKTRATASDSASG